MAGGMGLDPDLGLPPGYGLVPGHGLLPGVLLCDDGILLPCRFTNWAKGSSFASDVAEALFCGILLLPA